MSEIIGKVHHVKEVQEFDSGFKKQEFIVETKGEYPQQIKLELLKDKAGAIKQSDVGKVITVHYNLRGNEYNSNWYVNLIAWKFELGKENEVAPIGTPPEGTDEEGKTLPF